MRTISAKTITATVRDLCVKANCELRRDVLALLRRARAAERSPLARNNLKAILDNASCAAAQKLAICQDTGLPAVFIEMGQDIHVSGDLIAAIQKGVELGYRSASFRASIVADPLFRGKPGFTPVQVHIDPVKGSRVKLTVVPKGFGCENKTQLRMFNPTARIAEVMDFIVGAVKAAGPDACPPYIIGVGIGGTADHACLLAKKALLKKISRGTGKHANLEKELLKRINRLHIGPMGLGGKTTAVAVKVATAATHIAGLPVAVNISCHATRQASVLL